MSTDNEAVVGRLVEAINSSNLEMMDDLFAEDVVMDWPQSGERIVGGENRRAVYRAFPALPAITPRRMLSAGDLVVLEATADYGEGGTFQAVFIFQLRDNRIAKETAYWSSPFEPAPWRAQWVERM